MDGCVYILTGKKKRSMLNFLLIMHLSIFCPPGVGGGAGIHGALDRRPFLTGGNLTNSWNPGPG